MENLLFLGVPILKQITVTLLSEMRQGLFIKAGAFIMITVKILKFGTPQIAIIVLKIETFDVTVH